MIDLLTRAGMDTRHDHNIRNGERVQSLFSALGGEGWQEMNSKSSNM